MSFRVSGKNIDVGEALRARISERIAEATAKYFDGGFSGHVTVARKVSGSGPNARSISIRASCWKPKAMAADAYASADQAAVRIEKRLRRYKRRLKDHRADRATAALRSRRRAMSSRRPSTTTTRTDGFNPVIIAESTTALKRFGQRRGDGTRSDRRRGRGVPACRPWPRQLGLPPRRRPFRLDRSAGDGGQDAH